MQIPVPRPSKARLLLFGFGDFAFNLYWQSLMLFLLFYYSDALELPIRIAATIFMIGSIWDGVANFIAGLLVDRRQSTRGYGALLVVGSVPLALTFMLAYLPPLLSGWPGIATVFIAHLLFRTAYAAVNVPYLAMTARISVDSGDRAFVAGVRMLFGTLAAVLVALATVPLGEWLTGERDPVQAFLAAAAVFAGLGAVILAFVGATYREAAPPTPPPPMSVRAALASLAANRAFVTLNLAMMAMIVAVTVLNKTILYYFKYVLADPSGGQLALASMGIVSAFAVPLWMLLARGVGLRGLWFIAAGGAIAGVALFAAIDVGRSGVTQLFLVSVQAMIVGLNFVFWAMLPNTIEYGERETGLHVEGAVFGVAALLQRIAIGVATAILGWTFDSAGFVANAQQGDAALQAMRWTVTIIPLGFFALSCAAMFVNPLGRGTHRRVLRDLEAEAEPA
ncbi:MAG: glycoside-pentoside-hexuronide (GPH):cation symporter [Pseudomonadota bacterium]|nr:glycoside-pentoside-hexuronide (GPH):cation symporter [Pseudomonadota bacterium]